MASSLIIASNEEVICGLSQSILKLLTDSYGNEKKSQTLFKQLPNQSHARHRSKQRRIDFNIAIAKLLGSGKICVSGDKVKLADVVTKNAVKSSNHSSHTNTSSSNRTSTVTRANSNTRTKANSTSSTVSPNVIPNEWSAEMVPFYHFEIILFSNFPTF